MLLPYPYEHTQSRFPPLLPCQEAPSLPFPPLCLTHVQTRGTLTGRGSMSACHCPSRAKGSAGVTVGTGDSVPQGEKGGLAPRE